MGDDKQEIKQGIILKLRARRDVLEGEYITAMQAMELSVPQHARELLDEIDEIDEHLEALN